MVGVGDEGKEDAVKALGDAIAKEAFLPLTVSPAPYSMSLASRQNSNRRSIAHDTGRTQASWRMARITAHWLDTVVH